MIGLLEAKNRDAKAIAAMYRSGLGTKRRNEWDKAIPKAKKLRSRKSGVGKKATGVDTANSLPVKRRVLPGAPRVGAASPGS